MNFYNLGRNIDELTRKFKANIYMAEKPTEVCPSKWKDEGDKTLTPSAKLADAATRRSCTETSAQPSNRSVVGPCKPVHNRA